MEKFLYAEIMLINIAILILLWHNDVRKDRGPVLLNQKLFRILIWINIGAMFSDMVQIMFDGTHFWYSNIIGNVSIFFYYIFQSVIGFIFLLYVDYELYPDNKRWKKRLPYYAILAVISEVMTFSSFWTKWIFVIDENNSYIRGNLFYIHTIFAFVYMGYILYLLLDYRKTGKIDSNMQKELYNRLFVFPIIPWIGSLAQILLPGTPWVLPMTTIAILINHITIQNGYMARDYLTGLYNRSQLESFMNYQLRNLKKGNYFFLIILDLDKFKEINDTYGHLIGDDALINAAKLIRGSCKRKTDYVARLGGDEFAIIGQCKDAEAVDMIIVRMHEVVDNFNKTNEKPYKIMFSAGYAIHDGSEDATLDKMISIADDKMYEIKRAKKTKENIK